MPRVFWLDVYTRPHRAQLLVTGLHLRRPPVGNLSVLIPSVTPAQKFLGFIAAHSPQPTVYRAASSVRHGTQRCVPLSIFTPGIIGWRAFSSSVIISSVVIIIMHPHLQHPHTPYRYVGHYRFWPAFMPHAACGMKRCECIQVHLLCKFYQVTIHVSSDEANVI
jgi:hypothetical protein